MKSLLRLMQDVRIAQARSTINALGAIITNCHSACCVTGLGQPRALPCHSRVSGRISVVSPYLVRGKTSRKGLICDQQQLPCMYDNVGWGSAAAAEKAG